MISVYEKPLETDSEAREGDLSLSLVTYLTATENEAHCVIDLAREGRILQAHPLRSNQVQKKKAEGGKKGSIKEFSRKSRMNLISRVATLRGEAFCTAMFITLTYPGEYPVPRETKRHLDSFLKVIRRRFPDSAVIWKLEYQERGAPHYHLLVLGCDYWQKDEAKAAWHRIVGSDDPNHLQMGCHVDRVRSQRQAQYYIGKYETKASRVPENHFGRVWGTSGDVGAMASKKLVVSVSRDQYVKLRRVLDAIRASHSKKKFKRQSAVDYGQRWFMDGQAAELVISRVLDLSAIGPPSVC